MSWMVLILGIIIVGACLPLIRVFFFLVEVNGSSMLPTFQDQDRVITLRYWPWHWLRRGQIVVWVQPRPLNRDAVPNGDGDPLYIKRIVGLPGDEVLAPSVRLPEKDESKKWLDPDDYEVRKWKIPAKHYFVKGDSPGFDSTQLGPLPFHSLRGIVIAKLPRRKRSVTQSGFIDSNAAHLNKN